MERFLDSSRFKIKRVLGRGVVDSWDPPQRGLGVTGKSSTPQDKIVCQARLFLLLISILVFTFELFTLLELELYLVTLGCKPKLELVIACHRAFFVTN